MNVNTIKPNGANGPERPDRGRVDKVDVRRPDFKPVEGSSPSLGRDQVDLSSHGVDFDKRAKDLADQLVRSEDDRRVKVDRAKKLVASGAIDSREHSERAAEALLAEVNRDGRKG